MHQVVLNIDDTVFNTFLYFIKNLPAKDVTIVSDRVVDELESDSYRTLLSELREKKPYASITDAVAWQEEQRNEW